MNLRKESFYLVACVVKFETPPEWRWKLCEFQHGKSISESGINNMKKERKKPKKEHWAPILRSGTGSWALSG